MGVLCMAQGAVKQKLMLKVSKVLAGLVKLHSGIDWPVNFQINLTQKGVPLRYPMPKVEHGGRQEIEI